MWDGFDKRKFPRLNYNCEIEIETLDKKESVKAVTENVGAGGLCVMADKSITRFSKCGVRIDFGEGAEAVECLGKVVWIIPTKDAKGKKNRYDIGIEFIDMSEESLQSLRTRIEEAAAKGR